MEHYNGIQVETMWEDLRHHLENLQNFWDHYQNYLEHYSGIRVGDLASLLG